ncbi:nucleoside deaminase [Fulvivirgaceae bacterium PWU20]|uniref:Nucleoside deaminase n=1 Tax=Chryseosolibacter indicus TaxID=2782351 RepID=A0ABS5VQQ0_9BACT|nr:nucleoside deaminase [Chryseosolibacter indicus]MBT1703328.1 nucleoside deaminase [Chryseosolibacter indicus]
MEPTEEDYKYIQLAVELAQQGVLNNVGGPFGAVVVKDGEVIGQGSNKVTSTNDPTAHAEVVAIREACHFLQSYELSGCTIYASCEPCPMCLGAIYWSRPDRIVYACNRRDAASIGFDDDFIYTEIGVSPDQRSIRATECGRALGLKVFELWMNKRDKIEY